MLSPGEEQAGGRRETLGRSSPGVPPLDANARCSGGNDTCVTACDPVFSGRDWQTIDSHV